MAHAAPPPADPLETKADALQRWQLGCLAIIFAPFLLFGIVLLAFGIAAWGDPAAGNAWVAVVVGAVLIAVGAAPLLLQLAGKGSLLRGMRLQQKQPGRPWLWRDDWARGVIAGEARRILARHWLRAIAVSAFYILAIYVGFRHTPGFDLLSEHYPALSSLVLVILVLPPVCALGYAMYVSLRHRKFGASTFLMSVIPCQVGGRLAGSIEIRLQDLPQDGFLVRLSTIRTTGNRKYDKTIWSTEQTVGVERVSRGIGGVTVPVDIAIPDDAAPTGRVDSFSGRVDSFLSHYWRLTITASLPGIDFEAEFRPPVFRLDAEGRVPDDAPG